MDIKTITLDLGFRRRQLRDFVQLLKLNGSQWLRLLASETNLASFAGWCEQCGAGERAGEVCRWCGARLVQFDDKFWDRVGKKIRQALTKDRALIRRVKADSTFIPAIDAQIAAKRNDHRQAGSILPS